MTTVVRRTDRDNHTGTGVRDHGFRGSHFGLPCLVRPSRLSRDRYVLKGNNRKIARPMTLIARASC